MKPRWDIFCDVVDNFGDIGVCWRLARQLAAEYELEIRLWVNNTQAAKRLIPQLQLDAATDDSAKQTWAPQRVDGVTICHWMPQFSPTPVADVVIEAFACQLPAAYVAAMSRKIIYINLEYLSAEDWIADFHEGLSVHPQSGLQKTFFFPGFAPTTGGLLRERDLLTERDAFQASSDAQAQFWSTLGLRLHPANASIKVSLFCYPHAPIHQLLDTLASGEQSVHCLVPESSLLPTLAQYFGLTDLRVGDTASKGQLTLHGLPFLSQPDYDRLLWACNLNFVRGEDSWIRAIWAGKPFIWQPYHQDEDTHITKLQAFLKLYSRELAASTAQALQAAHLAWSGNASGAELTPTLGELMAQADVWKAHGEHQAQQLSRQENLAAKLVIFCQNRV